MRRQIICVNVRVENPLDLVAQFPDQGEHGIHRVHRDSLRIVAQDQVNYRCYRRGWAGDHVLPFSRLAFKEVVYYGFFEFCWRPCVECSKIPACVCVPIGSTINLCCSSCPRRTSPLPAAPERSSDGCCCCCCCCCCCRLRQKRRTPNRALSHVISNGNHGPRTSYRVVILKEIRFLKAM